MPQTSPLYPDVPISLLAVWTRDFWDSCTITEILGQQELCGKQKKGCFVCILMSGAVGKVFPNHLNDFPRLLPVAQARNLGVILDFSFSLTSHTHISKFCYFPLRHSESSGSLRLPPLLYFNSPSLFPGKPPWLPDGPPVLSLVYIIQQIELSLNASLSKLLPYLRSLIDGSTTSKRKS